MQNLTSGLIVELIPILEDNYVFAIINTEKNEAILIDPGEASACLQFLKTRHLTLTAILITHHHPDHVDGLSEILRQYPVRVYAPLKNKLQISLATDFLEEQHQLEFWGHTFKVLELPGHTLGIIAYWCETKKWLFSGDVLFGLSCGRIFEGTFEQMFTSLKKIKSLPNETLIYCTHEYTEMNLDFCKHLKPELEHLINSNLLKNYEARVKHLRAQNFPTVPLLLETEMNSNPFLRADNITDFTQLRMARNQYKKAAEL